MDLHVAIRREFKTLNTMLKIDLIDFEPVQEKILVTTGYRVEINELKKYYRHWRANYKPSTRKRRGRRGC